VQVSVDKARHHVTAGRVERRVTVVLAEPGDEAVDDREIALEPLAREGREHPPAANHDMGRLVAARDREPAPQIDHRSDDIF
jgi:hypothetical protein